MGGILKEMCCCCLEKNHNLTLIIQLAIIAYLGTKITLKCQQGYPNISVCLRGIPTASGYVGGASLYVHTPATVLWY